MGTRLRFGLVLAGVVLLPALGACLRHVGYDAEEGQKLQRLAVVVRVLGSADGDAPEAMRKGQEPAQLGKKVEAGMSPFEAAERVRSGLIEHLPDAPPWSNVLPGVQAESVLGELLTVDRPVKTPEFDELKRVGVDGVLYVQIDHWGVTTRDDQPGYYLSGSGRLFTLPGHDTIWQGPVERFLPGLPANWLETNEIRSRLGDICAAAGEGVALELGGTRQSVSRTPSLDQPDIEDTGHPPERNKPVIPFAVPERDGGVADAGHDGIDISVPDGGGSVPLP